MSPLYRSPYVYPPILTSIPAVGSDGQEFCYAASTGSGVMWTFRYRAASASSFKWEFVGGAPLVSQVAADENTASTTYAALTTAGPSIALPFAGDYMVSIGAKPYNTNAAAQFQNMSYDIGGTGAVDADSIQNFSPIANNPGRGDTSRVMLKTGLTAVTLTMKYKVSVGADGRWFDRWMNVIPVRVG